LFVAIHSAPLQSTGASIDKKTAHTMMEASAIPAPREAEFHARRWTCSLLFSGRPLIWFTNSED
jgi:hypothetical protein